MEYKNVGILALIYGIIISLSSLSDIILGNGSEVEISILSLVFSIIMIITYSKILIKFKELVNEKYNNDSINNLIYIFIGTNIILVLADLIFWGAGLSFDEINFSEHLSFVIFSVIFVIFIGIISIIYSVKLKKIKNKGNLKIYANIELISGILLLTIVGYDFAAFLSGIGFIYLYFIFKEESKSFSKTSKNYSNTQNKKEEVENYYDSLNLEEYNLLKEKVLEYLPKNLKKEEITRLIKEHIAKEIIN